MRSHIAIATLLGTIISVLLAVFNTAMTNTPFEYLQFPGYIAIAILWGPHGGPAPEFVSEVIFVGLNAIFYGLMILWILNWVSPRRPTSQIPKIS